MDNDKIKKNTHTHTHTIYVEANFKNMYAKFQLIPLTATEEKIF